MGESSQSHGCKLCRKYGLVRVADMFTSNEFDPIDWWCDQNIASEANPEVPEREDEVTAEELVPTMLPCLFKARAESRACLPIPDFSYDHGEFESRLLGFDALGVDDNLARARRLWSDAKWPELAELLAECNGLVQKTIPTREWIPHLADLMSKASLPDALSDAITIWTALAQPGSAIHTTHKRASRLSAWLHGKLNLLEASPRRCISRAKALRLAENLQFEPMRTLVQGLIARGPTVLEVRSVRRSSDSKPTIPNIDK